MHVGLGRRLTRLPLLFVLLPLFFLAALIFTYPFVLGLGNAVTDPVDPILNAWIVGWEHHILLRQPLELLNANIFYPYPQTLLYSETLLLPSTLLMPIQLATGNPILTHNLLVLLGLASTAGSGYLLGRWLFRSHWAGALLGIVFAFNSYTLSNLGQVQLLQLAPLPLALLYTGKVIRRPRLRFALLLAFFLTAQFYTVIYYGFFAFLLVGVSGGAGWLLYRFPSLRMRLHALGMLLGGGVLALLLCLPLGLPYYDLSQRYGYERTLADAWPFSTSFEMWMTPPAQNLLYGWMAAGDPPRLGFYPVDSLFPGFLLFGLALGGLIFWLWRAAGMGKRYPLALLLGIGFFFVLSLGPYLQLATLQPDFERILPYAWIHETIPGFEALRAPGRFAVVVFLGMAVAAASLMRHLRWRGLQFALILLLFAEALVIPATDLYTPPIDRDRRAFHEWLSTQDDTVYVELPPSSPGLGSSPHLWLEDQWLGLSHWQPTLAGYSGFWPPHHDDLLLFVARFPDPEAVLFLQSLGVEWILPLPDRLSAEQRQQIEDAIQAQGWETRTWGDLRAIRLPRIERDPSQSRYLIPDRAQAGGEVAVAAIFTSEDPTPTLPNSALGSLRVEWQQGDRPIRRLKRQHQPPFFVDGVALSSIHIPTPATEGIYTLRLLDGADRLLAASDVNVVVDAAPPESRVLPVLAIQAILTCGGDDAQIDLILRTVGWYEEPFTLSARLLDAEGAQVMRSADVEFPPHRPRANLRTINVYLLPLPVIPGDDALTVELIGYQWQQAAERIVPRAFVSAEGEVMDQLSLPLARSAGCGK
ncbi:MAG: hypothetical protein KF893_22275 [Caldilineaceae bacterium]|nr:hypothetical protein [Caldilineaceae bacterium]